MAKGARGGQSKKARSVQTVMITSSDGQTKIRLSQASDGTVYQHSDPQGGRYDKLTPIQGMSMKTLLNNAKKNGGSITKVTKAMLNQEKKRNKADSLAQDKALGSRASKKGVNRHSAYWSNM